jgi:diguanylate cyclase (GGDEF)-like protein
MVFGPNEQAERMQVINRVFNIGIAPDMAPEEAKYIGMSNAGVFFFVLFAIPFILYCTFETWYLIVIEMFAYAGLLCVTFWLNKIKWYTFALVWFGSVLNWHLIFLSVALGWDAIVHLLIFFTAGGAIMLFRRQSTGLMVIATLACIACYYIALGLSRLFPPLYRLSNFELTVLNTSIEITFIILIVVNGLIARYGAILAEDQLKEEKAKTEFLLEKIKKLDNQKTIFFQNISHEFRTPLTLIIGPIQQVMSGKYGPIGRVLKEQFKIVLRSANRLLRLINQLLDLSKLDAGKMPLKTKTVNLSKLAASVIDTFQTYSNNAGIKINMASVVQDILFQCDGGMIEKVISNLLSNALKFTPKGGEICIGISETNDGQQVNLSVKDTGCGIPEKEVPLIFDRFQQVDGTTTREKEGTGIGLSLVKDLVGLHDGTIHVETTEGSGSEFIVSLPKKTLCGDMPADVHDEYTLVSSVDMAQAAFDNSNERAVPADNDHTFEKEFATILVVEDNKDMRSFIKEGFAASCRVVEAGDGDEGFEKAKENMPDLIISDVMMPKMDGYQLCKFIKGDEALQHIPVILLTAKASEEMAVKSLEAGAHDYVTKPFSLDVLKAKVDGIIYRQEEYVHMSRTDHLTKLRNREGWKLAVQRELDKIKRYGGTASIAFIDLDNFKTINDTYGHSMGDGVLKVVSSIICKGLRETDIAGRYGGEEFVVFFPETPKAAAAECLERILSKLRNYHFKEDSLHCAFSAGIVGVDQDRMISLAQYVSNADAVMYAAKKRGKGCIVVQNQTQ